MVGWTRIIHEDKKPSRVIIDGIIGLIILYLFKHLQMLWILGDIEVILAGICATPALHGASLLNQCHFVCMVTASHNPVQDSGIKIFNKNGLKTTPEQEIEISQLANDLWQEEIAELIPENYKPLSAYTHFDADGFHQQEIENLLQTSDIQPHSQISRPLSLIHPRVPRHHGLLNIFPVSASRLLKSLKTQRH